MLDSRPRGRGFESHGHHCVVSLSRANFPCLVQVQPRKTRPDITENVVDLNVKDQIKQTKTKI